MGSNASKPNGEAAVQIQKNEDVGDNSDPRSPTPEIVRTPLHGKCGGKHNITKNVDLRKTFENTKGEEKLIHNNPILSAVIKNHLQSYDPRSPTQEFERTPIVIASKIDEVANDKQLLRLQNENNCGSPSLRDDNDNLEVNTESSRSPDLVVPKNLCEGFFDMSLNETIKETEEPLGSSTASNEAIENNISPKLDNPTKFLETNFDYVENDSKKFEDSQENDMKIEELDESNILMKGIPQFKILNDDPRSPSVGIERTPIVVAKKLEGGEGNVEEMSDDTLIKVLQNTNAELRQNVAKSQDMNPEGLMIYEDELALNKDTPRKYKSTSNSGCRTPLSCMKNKTESSHTRSKSANTFDPKTQKVGQAKRTSHIPRLKSLTKPPILATNGSTVSLKNISRASVISGDCENTPPHSHRDRWDKDNSIVL